MPLEELLSSPHVIGVRSVARGLRSGNVRKVFVAGDAEADLLEPLLRAARECGVEVEWVESTRVLGRACLIHRPAAAAGVADRIGSEGSE